MIEFKVAGFVELENALRKLPEVVAGAFLEQSLREAGQPMAASAKRFAPRSDSTRQGGHMADSIAIRKLKNDTTRGLEATSWVGPDRKHFYGMFSEFGTVHQTARPFLRPAFESEKSPTIDRLGKSLWVRIEREARKRERESRGAPSRRP